MGDDDDGLLFYFIFSLHRLYKGVSSGMIYIAIAFRLSTLPNTNGGVTIEKGSLTQLNLSAS